MVISNAELEELTYTIKAGFYDYGNSRLQEITQRDLFLMSKQFAEDDSSVFVYVPGKETEIVGYVEDMKLSRDAMELTLNCLVEPGFTLKSVHLQWKR